MTMVDEIPVAHTPPGGYGSDMPPPVLAGCSQALIDGAPDLRGTWQVIAVDVNGLPVEQHNALGSVQRVEQAGDRIVITASGVVHDMRCDGTYEHGVHDVMQADFTTVIDVIAGYENGVHVLRPQNLPMEITVERWRDGDHMMWKYFGFTARLERLDT